MGGTTGENMCGKWKEYLLYGTRMTVASRDSQRNVETNASPSPTPAVLFVHGFPDADVDGEGPVQCEAAHGQDERAARPEFCQLQWVGEDAHGSGWVKS